MNLTRRESIQALAALGAGALAPAAVRAAEAKSPAVSAPLGAGADFQAEEPKEWSALWVVPPEGTLRPVGIYHFRLGFALDAVPTELTVRVSADQRYRLFLNGVFIGSGPAQGDPQHWRYETYYNLAAHLRPGRNCWAAQVWYGEAATAGLNQMGSTPGFLLSTGEPTAKEGKPPIETGVAPWRVEKSLGHTFLPIRSEDAAGYFALGPTERIDATLVPWGWTDPDYDDSAWVAATPDLPGRPRGFTAQGGNGGHFLEPSPLLPQELTPQPLGRFVRVEGLTEALPEGALVSASVTIPANTQARLLIDHAMMTTAMLHLETDRGDAAIVRLRYAEALVDAEGNRGDRNEVAGRRCQGYADEFILDGKARTFEPLYWRTFRYLQVEIDAADEPVVLRRLTTVFSAAPLARVGRFTASDPELATIWQTGVRTVRCNAHETFSDCPYWEQLQYIGDTRLSVLISFAFAGPHAGRMARNALALFDASRIPEGITQSRYPSREVQLIPTFSLWYVTMLDDYRMHSDEPQDAAFLRTLLPGVRGILNWFLQRINPRGLLGPLPWWSFVDWAFDVVGYPPGATNAAAGGSSILTLQMVLALRAAAAVEQAVGEPARAEECLRRADQLAARVRELCWDASRGVMADVPLGGAAAPSYSQHATSFAILAGALSGAETKRAGEALLASVRATDGAGLLPATLYFRYYVHRALVVAGQGASYVEWLGPWRRELALGLTTWPETPSPTRSDCHAWSSHPTRDLLTVVLGVESAAPGFRQVAITPRLGKLEWAEGVVAHPRGEIAVKLRRVAGGVSVEISLPAGVPGVLIFAGKSHSLAGNFSAVLAEDGRGRA
jgi:hypothetical protein